MLPLVYVHCGPVVDFFIITKQTSLHPFDFVRNLFHLLVIIYNGRTNQQYTECAYKIDKSVGEFSTDIGISCLIIISYNSHSHYFLDFLNAEYFQ